MSPRARGRQSRIGRESGFTLLETLVALAVLSVVLAVIPRPLVQARATLDDSAQWLRARMVMDAVLADPLGPGMPLVAGQRSGTIDGVPWTARLTQSPLTVRSDSAWLLLTVAVEVAMPRGPTLRADTLRFSQFP